MARAKVSLLGVVGVAAELAQIGVHQYSKGFVGKHGIVAVHHLVLHARTCAKGGRLRGGDHPFEQALDDLGAGVAHVVVHLGELGDDIRRIPAIGDDVVHAGVRRHMLAHQIDHEVHRLHAIKGRAAPMGAEAA